MTENSGFLSQSMDNAENDKDFTVDDLVLLKEMLLKLEKAIDEIKVKFTSPGLGETFEGGYMFSLLEKADVCKSIDDSQNRNYWLSFIIL